MILNELFCSVFRQRLLDHETDEELADGSDDGDSLGDLDDLMSGKSLCKQTWVGSDSISADSDPTHSHITSTLPSHRDAIPSCQRGWPCSHLDPGYHTDFSIA